MGVGGLSNIPRKSPTYSESKQPVRGVHIRTDKFWSLFTQNLPLRGEGVVARANVFADGVLRHWNSFTTPTVLSTR